MSNNLLTIADNARRESIKKMKKLPPLQIRRDISMEENSITTPPTSNNITPIINEIPEYSFSESSIDTSILSVNDQQTSKERKIDISSDMRQNIRKKAKSALEVKRGSIQLQKRLLRNKTLSINMPKQIFENDIDKIDDQIERVIKLGEKYETKKDINMINDNIQYRFVSHYFDKYLENKDVKVIDYVPASPIVRNMSKIKELLIILDDKINSDDLERGNMSLNKFNFRVSQKFQQYDNLKLEINKVLLCAEKVLKYNRSDWEETSLIENVWRESKNKISKENRRKHYENIKLSISKIKLYHHWLFTKEHIYCRKVEETYEILLFKANTLLSHIKIYLTAKSLQENVDELEDKIETEVKEYQEVSDKLQFHWEKLITLRLQQGYQRTSLMLTSKEMEEQDLSFFSSVLQNFYRNPIFSLTYNNDNIRLFDHDKETDEITIEKESQKEKKFNSFFNNLEKCEWEVQIFFNDIFVCRTKPKCLTKDFQIIINEDYNLQIHDTPESIVIVLYERFNRGVFKRIAKIGIPLEQDNNDQNMGNVSHFATDAIFEGMIDSIGAGGIGRQCLSGVFCSKLNGYGVISSEEFKKQCNIQTSLGIKEGFQLIPNETRICDDSMIENDLRLHALKNRFLQSQYPGNIEERIPIYSNEIENKHLKIEDLTNEEYGKYGFGIEGFKISAKMYAIKMRTELVQNMEGYKKKLKSYSDIVKEESIPNIFSGLNTLFGSRDVSRKLKPMRNEIKKQTLSSGFKLNFILSIQSATNIGEKLDGTKIHSFVEVSFQSKIYSTKISDGKNPKWQETITIPFNNNIMENKSLNSIIEKFTIRLYDQIIVPLKHDDREVNTIHEQIEYHYLGKVEIPFYTVYMNGKIDGILPIHRVSFLNGYIFEGMSYLKLMISLDPLIAFPPHKQMETSVSTEHENILMKYKLWKRKCDILYPHRQYKGLVLNNQGKSVIACRYIHPVRPPHLFDEYINDKFTLIYKIIEFVQAIPTIDDAIMFPGICDLWTNIDQTLTIGCGDEEEHAIIFICWLLYYGIKSFLVLGNGLPEGLRSAYVLIELEEKLYIINPVEGFLWNIKDVNIPLLSVGTVISDKNIYGNIQKQEHPYSMSFDFTREDCWKGIFDNNSSDFVTVQNEVIIYQNINDGLLIELKSLLEREIKTKINELRQYGIPQWNILVARTLKEIISDPNILDENKEIEKRLNDNFGSIFKINCIILKIPFLSQKQLITEILSTKIYLNTDNGVQFAVSVHLIPYINNILQCYVGLASLIPV
uniref:CC2D2AN-C2 domain-containing protein n=1 Tax=Parastrongyloides trichosuri TaxID=131310 RepID=A0A0N4ZND5_PARTI